MSLRNPVVPSQGDTARFYNPPGSNNLVVKPNYKELKVSSFNTYNNGDPAIGDPSNFKETYYNLQGFQRLGTPWINPATLQSSKYPFSGDPVTSKGWLQTTGNDRRSLISIGPLNMSPNDTQSVIIAQVIARGSSNLNSITKLRELSNYVRGIYNNNFQDVLSVNNISSEIPDGFELKQNYPNPFNPTTNLEFKISKSGFVNLKIFDMLGKEVATLVNENLKPGTYRYNFDASNLTSGIYFYKLSAEGFSDTKRMILLK